MVQTNKNKNILRTGYSPITKTYQDIANNMGNTSNSIQKDSSGDKTLQIYKDIASQMPSPNGNTVPTSTPTPATSTNENSDIVKAYQESANRLLSEKEALDPNDKNYRIEADTYNSKIESTNELIKSYMQNSKNSISAKANAELAQQNAVNGTAAYLKALGLSGQGIAESTMADVNKNYANAMAGIEAQENENNSNAQNSYLEALKQAESERQSRLDAKEAIEEERKYQENKEASNNYYKLIMSELENAYDVENYIDDKGKEVEDMRLNKETLDRYKEQADKYYQDGKLSQSQYDLITNTYRELAIQYSKENGYYRKFDIMDTSNEDKINSLISKECNDYMTNYLNASVEEAGQELKEGLVFDDTSKNYIYHNNKWYSLKSDGSSSNASKKEKPQIKESSFSAPDISSSLDKNSIKNIEEYLKSNNKNIVSGLTVEINGRKAVYYGTNWYYAMK